VICIPTHLKDLKTHMKSNSYHLAKFKCAQCEFLGDVFFKKLNMFVEQSHLFKFSVSITKNSFGNKPRFEEDVKT
jgi:hypothetical protein